MTKEERKIYLKIWRENNPEKVKNHTKAASDYQKNYRKEYKIDKIKSAISKNKYRKKKLKTDSLYKLTSNIRVLICNNIKRKGYRKTTKTTQILGCTFDEFKQHLESQFQDWMNWENHGKYNGTKGYGWDIDHIIPISTATTEDDIIRLNHYTNLQPLCSKINRDIKRHN